MLKETKDSYEGMLESAISWFEDIAEMCAKLTTGNVSHQGTSIRGKAIRAAEYIKKKNERMRETTNEEKATKVYLILYNSHEFDDMDEGKDDIVFASLDEEKAMKKFKQDVENIKTNRPLFSFGDYEENEDNTKTNFQCYWGNRCYSLKLQEFELK